MQFREDQMFQRNVLPLPSLSKRKPNRKSKVGGKLSLFLACSPGDGEDVFLRNLGPSLNYKVLQPIKLYTL
jgi:hypothetical protein